MSEIRRLGPPPSELGGSSLPPPALFPLRQVEREFFAEAGGAWFGWKGSTFQVRKPTWKVLREFPLTEAGWSAAWEWMLVDLPHLATAIASQVAATDDAAKVREEFGGLATIAEIADCTLLGGHGWNSPDFETGASCTLSFTTEGLWVRPPSGWQPLIRSPYQEATALEFSGPGRQSSGGRFFGGGFGLLGAAEGMVAATVLNALTARTTIHTMVRYQAVNLEAFFFCATETPDQLRVRLSQVLSMVEPPAPRVELSGIASELTKLAELHATGALTDQEFATLKARLIAAL